MSGIFSVMQPMQQALSYHMERHNVLSTNIAHVDTPGFRPMELERAESQNFGRELSVALTRTTENHLSLPLQAQAQNGRIVPSEDLIAGLDGNQVSLDREASKVAANQLRFEVVSALASAQLRQLSHAASDGRG
ncbi:MAG: flagellar basal body rod protein FlgB [Polyangiaceae bacterium]|nr:flagellar basal body rod protein FlgB [Polyangiaceae bacterium]